MKKLIAGILCAVLVLGTALSLSGCGDKNYPVKIANLTIDKEPKSIVVLDPNSADIISYMGYDVKIVGRSREVDQKYLGVAPVMGSAVSPSVQDIIDSGATVVFANEGLNDDFEQSLEKEGIAVIKMSVAETPKQLETNYHTIGKILGGNDDGDAKAASSYDKLISAMEQRKSEASAKNATALDTVCYLYYEQGGLRLMTSGTYGDMLLGYTGSVNVAVNIDENKVDVNTLRRQHAQGCSGRSRALEARGCYRRQDNADYKRRNEPSGTYRSRNSREDDWLYPSGACKGSKGYRAYSADRDQTCRNPGCYSGGYRSRYPSGGSDCRNSGGNTACGGNIGCR